jgi:hypothetical protein
LVHQSLLAGTDELHLTVVGLVLGAAVLAVRTVQARRLLLMLLRAVLMEA